MAKMTNKDRPNLPDKAFALPTKRAFPVPDASHAKAAMMDAPKSVKAGSITPAQKAMIDKRALAALNRMRNKVKN